MAIGRTNAPGGGGRKTLLDKGAPTAALDAKVGQLYADTDAGSIYICVGVTASGSAWQKVGATGTGEIEGGSGKTLEEILQELLADLASTEKTLKETKKELAESKTNLCVNIFHVGTSAPSNTKLLWIDTNSTTGGLKYHNGSSWVHVPVAYT